MSPTSTPSPTAQALYLAQVFIEDNAGHRVQTLAGVSALRLGLGLRLSSGVLQADGEQSLSIFDDAGALLGTWNGSHADGGLATPGAYRVRVVWTLAGEVKAEATVMLAVQPAANALVRSAKVAPNPAGRLGSERVTLHWMPDNKTAWVRGRLYNLAGELIVQGQADAALGRLDWDLRTNQGQAVSGGIYFWELEALAGDGRVLERKGVKFVVVR